MSESLVPSGFFVLRAPLLPFADWLVEETEAAAAPPDRLEWAIARDRDARRARLREAIARPAVRDALEVASPALIAALPEWLRDPESRKGQGVERGVVKYLGRMATRSTPFGLFAGCGTGRLAERTELSLGDSLTRSSRLDHGYLTALAEALARDPAIRAHVRWSTNGSLYPLGDEVRYAESRDGITWRRDDSKAGMTVSESGWDSEMIAYPFVFAHAGRLYMLYNGNRYGETGFGIAVLEP